MKTKQLVFIIASLLVFLSTVSCTTSEVKKRPRIIVSTDIGGTDFDDYQSLVHLLVYADTFDIEGIISSPFGEGRTAHIFECIDAYEKDFPNLQAHSKKYPAPDEIRSLVKQGETEIAGLKGYSESTEGSDWIIECARKEDPRPLNVLIWGGIEDLAQALHDAPDILPKLRVYFIGGPNKKWSVNAYIYIVENHPDLWIIESNASYRGWFVGGVQEGDFGNETFVEKHVKNKGALGTYFYKKGETMKMGDTPSLTYFLSENPGDPTIPNWGGTYVRAWDRAHHSFHRITSLTDSIEEFGVLEIKLSFSETIENAYAFLNIENQKLEAEIENSVARFLFSPKRSGNWEYSIESNINELNQLEGQLFSNPTPHENKQNPSGNYPNWWVDDPSPEYKEYGHIGIRTINRWRQDFLNDFSKRMERCASAK